MKRVLVAIAAALGLILPLSIVGVLLAVAGDTIQPSDAALDEVPAEMLPLYQAAAESCEGLDWTILAAIHKVETSFGTGRAESSKGAQGPMQFMPPTFRAYATDGDGDGRAEINNVADAIFSAANMLCANGAGDPARLSQAIWSYNHSDAYVAEVLALAASYGVVQLGSLNPAAVPTDLLANPRVILTANARADLEAGVVDGRILALLDALSRRHVLAISVFKTGHSIRSRSGSISNHYYGRAVDISFVDGEAVSSLNLAARAVVIQLAALTEPFRPTELGHPFTDIQVAGGFSDDDHADHIHIGFDD
ncbi:MAG: hypothetical protein QOG54_1398 [Actinomycetota bacterium]|nr:hypothetical protein [Actinomycetota bacterium]